MAIKTITVLGSDLVVRREGIAAGVITPGHLIQGPDTDLIVHAGAAGTTLAKFAVENDVVGGDIDDDYADNDTVLYGVFPAGSIAYVLADGTGVTAEDIVESNGDGTFQVQAASASTDQGERASVVGKAMDTAGPDARFRLEIF